MRPALFALALLAVSTASASQTILDLAEATPDLSTLVAALKADTALIERLDPSFSSAYDTDYTVFAPSNEAFNKLPASELISLLQPANLAQLDGILKVHIVEGNFESSKLVDGEQLLTVGGGYVTVHIAGADVFIDSSKVTTANVAASNGVVHIVDTVLMPAAPTPAPPPAPGAPTPAPGIQNIVQLAAATADLSTLVAALSAGGLEETLAGKGPFTVFAPTNEAFAALPAGVVANLLKPANKAQLVDILTYHVASGRVFAADLENGQRYQTVEGKYVNAAVNASGVFINDAAVTTADVSASNGVVHIVDHVLLPDAVPQPGTLLFRGFTNSGTGRCGEVDAGPRLPTALFEPQNAAALARYVNITIDLFRVDIGYDFGLPLSLELGACKDAGKTAKFTNPLGSQKVDWAPAALMEGICAVQCGCNFQGGSKSAKLKALPVCKDAPDDPSAMKWCSLCGPLYNKPIDVKLYGCSDIRGGCK